MPPTLIWSTALPTSDAPRLQVGATFVPAEIGPAYLVAVILTKTSVAFQ
jgi:hypothetical protein